MKLLHIYPTFAVGGAQARFVAIANHFGRRWQHVIVAMDGISTCRERLNPELDVRFLDAGVIKGDTLGNLRRFRAILRAEQPGCLVTSNWGSIEWGMAATGSGIRHVHMEDGFGPDERTRQISRRVWTRRVVLHRREILVPSQVLYCMATQTWRLPRKRVHYVPNGIDLSRFSPRATGRDGVPVIGTVAALRAEKNLSRLLHAVAAMRNPARLVIVGGGPEREMLGVLAAELGIAERVTFAGHQTDTAPFYRDFDIFALSSDTEQMPLSVLEAMAAGLPVVSTDVGDVAGMVSAENTRFIVDQNPENLANALDGLAGNDELRRSLGRSNRQKAERDYSDIAMFEAHAALYEGKV